MGLNLKQVLDDDKTYADSIEIVINNEKVSLGDLRGLSRSQQTELSNRIKAAEDKFSEVTELATKAASIKADLEAKLAEASKSKTPPTEDELDTDPFWAPVNKKVKAYGDTLNQLQDTVKKLSAAAERMATIWAEDRWMGQFDRVKDRLKGDKYKDYDFKKIKQYAADHKILDDHGLPSVERAVIELTRNDDVEERIRLAKEEGLKEGIMKGRMGTTTRPTSASGPKKDDKSPVAEHGLEGLGDAVAEDKELTEMLAALGATDPSQFGAA